MNEMYLWMISGIASVAAGVTTYGAAYPRAQLFGPTVSRTGASNKLAITFDDGPNPTITPKLLDLLAKYNARATFFLVGKFVRECPELTKEILARGHALGNHTDTHPTCFCVAARKPRKNCDAVPTRFVTPPESNRAGSDRRLGFAARGFTK